MTTEQFQSALRMRPFRSFAIHTASGESYKVAHPESAWQSPDGETVIVATGPRGACALMSVGHITEVVYPSGEPATKLEPGGTNE